MPSVRIRTHDPESVSFFTAKLADCGFDVEFATPGQRVRGAVDLEITVNYAKESAAARRTRKSGTTGRPEIQSRVEWTTPYHVDAPDLADEIGTGPTRKNNVEEDRDLARILAGGSKRGDMFVIGIREDVEEEESEESQPLPEANLEPLEPPVLSQPRVLSVPAQHAPAPVARTPVRASSTPRTRPLPSRSRMPQRSFLQRHAASATAMIFVAAILIFYMSLFGTPKPPTNDSQPRYIPPQAANSATPVSSLAQPAAPPVTDAAPGLTQTDTATAPDPVKPSPSFRHKKPVAQQNLQQPEPSTQEEPEVTVRHFPTVQE